MQRILMLTVNMKNLRRKLIRLCQPGIDIFNGIEIIHNLLGHMQFKISLLPGQQRGQISLILLQYAVTYIHTLLIPSQPQKRIRLQLPEIGLLLPGQGFLRSLQGSLIIFLHLPGSSQQAVGSGKPGRKLLLVFFLLHLFSADTFHPFPELFFRPGIILLVIIKTSQQAVILRLVLFIRDNILHQLHTEPAVFVLQKAPAQLEKQGKVFPFRLPFFPVYGNQPLIHLTDGVPHIRRIITDIHQMDQPGFGFLFFPVAALILAAPQSCHIA